MKKFLYIFYSIVYCGMAQAQQRVVYTIKRRMEIYKRISV